MTEKRTFVEWLKFIASEKNRIKAKTIMDEIKRLQSICKI